MGLEPTTSRVRTERTAARAPGPHGQMADTTGIEPAITISSVTGSRGRPDSPTCPRHNLVAGSGAGPMCSAYEAVLRTGAPATHRDAENFREGKTPVGGLRNLRDARASPLQR